MTFNVVDRQTGMYPDVEKIALTEEWAKNLVYCDIDGFALHEDGNLILLDDCGNAAYCPPDRFDIVLEQDDKDVIHTQPSEMEDWPFQL